MQASIAEQPRVLQTTRLNQPECGCAGGQEAKHTLPALGRAADSLRVELGESLSSIQRFDVPLAQATTSSLEALEAYSLGLSKFGRGDQSGSILLFQRAIELDPDFAMAYANLGRAYQVLGRGSLSDQAIRKAFALRSRASEREKFDITSVYVSSSQWSPTR